MGVVDALSGSDAENAASPPARPARVVGSVPLTQCASSAVTFTAEQSNGKETKVKEMLTVGVWGFLDFCGDRVALGQLKEGILV